MYTDCGKNPRFFCSCFFVYPQEVEYIFYSLNLAIVHLVRNDRSIRDGF